MVDITNKNPSLKVATAKAMIKVSNLKTIKAIQNDEVPKGNVFAMSKAAGLLGVKKTPFIFPNSYSLPIEFTEITYEIHELEIKILLTVKTIYKTGVEIAAMHGASIVALNMYDMLKPIDKGIEIKNIKLIEKKEKKHHFKNRFKKDLKAAVIVCSDTIFAGKKEDKAGKAVVEKLNECEVQIIDYILIPDEKELIQEKTLKYQQENMDLIIFTGGTGLSVSDVTPDAILPLLDRRIPGIEETIRNYGQDRTPYSMLSRSVAGTIENTLILAIPGSTNGAKESMDAIFPAVLNAFKMLKRSY